jgi:excisionase family DNA binding protein
VSQSKSGPPKTAQGRELEVLESQWLSRSEALYLWGKSKATLDRAVHDHLIQNKLEKRAGRKPERLYFREDIEKLAAQAQSREVALIPRRPTELAIAEPTIAALGSSIASAVSQCVKEARDMPQRIDLNFSPGTVVVIDAFIDSVMTRWRDAIRPPEPPLLCSEKEASKIAGVPIGYIQKLTKAGKLGVRRVGRRRLIPRNVLHEYFTGPKQK